MRTSPSAPSSTSFDPRDRHLEELEVVDHDVVARPEPDRPRGDAQTVRGALDERDLVLAGAEQRRRLAHGAAAQLVHGDVVRRRVPLGAEDGALEEARDRLPRLHRREADRRRVEEDLALQAGEEGPGVAHVHLRSFEGAAPAGIGASPARGSAITTDPQVPQSHKVARCRRTSAASCPSS